MNINNQKRVHAKADVCHWNKEKASNGSLFNGNESIQIIYDIPAMSGEYYLDSAATPISSTLTYLVLVELLPHHPIWTITCIWKEAHNTLP